jgi:hypothetical protein
VADGLSASGAWAWARARESTYRKVLGFSMLFQLVIAGGCLLAPNALAHMLGLPPPLPTGWMRGWGAMLLLVTALYLPGLQNPLYSRYPNIVGVLGRVWTAIVWLFIGGGFFWLGALDVLFAAALAWQFYRCCVAEIMSRP